MKNNMFTEKLTRAFIAMQTAKGIFLSWRSLREDNDEIVFHIYRDDKFLAESKITNYTDKNGSSESQYTLHTIKNEKDVDVENLIIPILKDNENQNGNFMEYQLVRPKGKATVQFRNPRQDLYNATGKYYYMPIDINKLNEMQDVVTDFQNKKISKAIYDKKVAEFKSYTDSLGLDESGGDAPTLRELGYKEDGKVPYRKDADGKIIYTISEYTVSDMSVGDLDGDGEYELIVKWDPDNSRDSMYSYATTAPCIIDAYKLRGNKAELMWRTNIGYNMKASAHTTQIMVYDFDNDGRAEMIIRTVEGTTSGNVIDGEYIPKYFVGDKKAAFAENYLKENNEELFKKYTSKIMNNHTIVWEDPIYNNENGEAGEDGYITTGAYTGDVMNQTWCKLYCYGPTTDAGEEYISVYDGETGEIVDTIPYKFATRESAWGINPTCRRGAGCRFQIACTDAIRSAENASDSEYKNQSFWFDAKNDFGNRYELFGGTTGNHAERFLGTVANLDGDATSAVLCRGYYARTTLAAYTYKNRKLNLDCYFDSAEFENHQDYECRGNHNLAVGDVDADGKDEILYGAITFEKKKKQDEKLSVKYITCVALLEGDMPETNTLLDIHSAYDENGNLKDGYKYTYNYHGDAIHLLTMDKSGRKVIVTPHEDMGDEKRGWAVAFDIHDAATGEILAASFQADDLGRAAAGNINPRKPDRIIASGNISIDMKEIEITNVSAGDNNLIYWTGSLVRQMMDKDITQVAANGEDYETVMEFTGTQTNNGTKTNPCLQLDLWGDWREEVIRRVGRDIIRIYTTNMPTPYKIVTPMQDDQYRKAVANANICYNQPPHLGYFLGYEDGVTNVNESDGNSNNNVKSLIPDTEPII